jgi:DUF4097 and DUF4098 domain-containing protein YvlB
VPRVPSVIGPLILVAIGIIALLIYSGHVDSAQFWAWYGHWWPLLLIGAGLAMLGEWALDARSKTPVRRGGNFVGLLVVLAIVGVWASWAHSNWSWMHSNFGDNNDFFNMLGRPQHDLDQQVLNTQIPANGVVDIDNPRGDVSITAGEGGNVQVEAHEVAYADSDGEARKIFESEKASVKVAGNAVQVYSSGHSNGRVNLTLVIPKSAHVTINSGHGIVDAAGLGAGAVITARHGEVHLNTIQGSVQVHFTSDRGDLSAHQMNGDLTADGRYRDLTLTQVKGAISVSGDLTGTVHMEDLSGPVHLHTSVTDMQFEQLPGDMTLDDEDLRVTEAKGPVRVTTHSKNVELTQIYGDTYVEDRNGNISISPAGAFGIDARSTSGEGNLDITLPPNASATVNGSTHNGDIDSEYPLDVSGDQSKTVTGRIGTGSAKIVLSTDVGDLRIKKGSGFPATPPPPASAETPAAPEAPAPPNARHLKAPKTPPQAPVAQ